MLRFLGERYRVDLVFEGPAESNHDKDAPFAFEGVRTVSGLPLWKRAAAPFSPLPVHHAMMDQDGFADAIRRMAGKEGYAFVWMNKSWLYPSIRKALPGVPVFIEQHAAERDVWENLVRNDPRWYIRLYSRWNGRKVMAFERRIYPDLAGAVSISARDAETTCASYPPIPLAVVPMGVDCSYYRPSDSVSDPRVLLFSGGGATRNVEAMRRYVTRIGPLLKADEPGIRLLWIGKVDERSTDFLPHESVELTGYVEHVPPYFDRGAIFIAPFDMGEGVKVKIVEALAMGKLIVSTPVGIRGLDIDDQPFVRVAEDDRGFARAILELVRDPSRPSLAAAARRYAEDKFDCNKVVEALPAFIDAALSEWGSRRRTDGA